MTKSKRKKKKPKCICETVYDQDAVLLNRGCPVHGKRKA